MKFPTSNMLTTLGQQLTLSVDPKFKSSWKKSIFSIFFSTSWQHSVETVAVMFPNKLFLKSMYFKLSLEKKSSYLDANPLKGFQIKICWKWLLHFSHKSNVKIQFSGSTRVLIFGPIEMIHGAKDIYESWGKRKFYFWVRRIFYRPGRIFYTWVIFPKKGQKSSKFKKLSRLQVHIRTLKMSFWDSPRLGEVFCTQIWHFLTSRKFFNFCWKLRFLPKTSWNRKKVKNHKIFNRS